MRYINMTKRILMFLVFGCVLLLQTAAQTEFVKDCGQRSFPRDVPAGNYSGITNIGGNEYAVVSDKSDVDGFFVFKIDVDTLSGEIKSVENTGFRGDSLKSADCEGIVFLPSTSTLFISRESDNVIAEYGMDGRATGRRLNVPQVFREKTAGNYGFEALTYDEQSHRFWTINESALNGDGERANSTNSVENMLRLQSFNDSLQPESQYFYKMDAPIAASPAGHYVMGVSELLAVGDGRLLVLEREFFVPKAKIGAFVQCKIYEIKPEPEFSVSSGAQISPSTDFLPKKLLHSFTTKLTLFGRSLANYEGMCLGPRLADGSRCVILVSDSQNQYAGVLKDFFRTIIIR